jgi:hypothetical protein
MDFGIEKSKKYKTFNSWEFIKKGKFLNLNAFLKSSVKFVNFYG